MRHDIGYLGLICWKRCCLHLEVKLAFSQEGPAVSGIHREFLGWSQIKVSGGEATRAERDASVGGDE